MRELVEFLGFKDGKTPCPTTSKIDMFEVEDKLGKWIFGVIEKLGANSEAVTIDGQNYEKCRKQDAEISSVLSAIIQGVGAYFDSKRYKKRGFCRKI